MTTIESGPAAGNGVSHSTDELLAALRDRVDGEVRFDRGSRAAYSTDGSNFRQVPIGVVVPRSVEAGAEAIRTCRDFGAPVLSRGGGTSLAGQCTNTAVVIDWTKYCNRVLSVDPDQHRCVVEPGIVLDDLNRELAAYGLEYGPRPSTHYNCTIGGMIGNNSCGSTAQRTGKVADNLFRMQVMLYDGTTFWCSETTDEEYGEIERRGDSRAAIYRGLRHLRDRYADEIRARYPDIPRRVSGYNLDALLPENGFHVARALVGSESTLVTVLRAELDLVPVLQERSMVILGYPSIDEAADAVPEIVAHDPVMVEGVDHYLIHDEQIKGMNPDALARLPSGPGYLMVQFGGDDKDEVEQAAHRLLDELDAGEHAPHAKSFTEPDLEDELWLVRESGLGATAHIPHRPDTYEGWEDSAVPIDRLGDYLRDLRDLFDQFGYRNDAGPSLYGHFGQGCVHTRIQFDLKSTEGVAHYRRFMERAADLVASYGGSFSGEHGDGQSRGELLPKMFGETIVGAFGELKHLFDPTNKMNPGKLVHPAPLDAHLRLGGHWPPTSPQDLYFGFPEDEGSFVQAAGRCVGVGKCRQHSTDGGEVMCPSYQVTGEEEHSTRGRARLLFEMLNGHPDGTISDGWRSTEVRDALDLCLACKGCKTDCPANVDMATYKAEFLAHHYAGRLRPRADYATGWLPLAAAAVARVRAAGPVNALSHAPVLRNVLPMVAGLERREIPLFATETFQDWFARHEPAGDGRRGTVLLWPDTFTNHFHPHVGQAAVRLLESAGWGVTMPSEPVCCGLTWISTGQLPVARQVLRRTVHTLAPHVESGGYVVGLEPSCTTVFRSDAPDLFTGDQDVQRLQRHTVTLAELLTEHTPGWEPSALTPRQQRAIVQVHCHQHAVLGWDADAALLEKAGVQAEQLESGCCGLAGNFGFTAGHGQVSHDLAERVLMPRVREADEDTAVLADGFSCRTQVHEHNMFGHEGQEHEAVHLAELFDAEPPARPQPPGVAARWGALAAVAAATAAPAAAAATAMIRYRKGTRS